MGLIPTPGLLLDFWAKQPKSYSILVLCQNQNLVPTDKCQEYGAQAKIKVHPALVEASNIQPN